MNIQRRIAWSLPAMLFAAALCAPAFAQMERSRPAQPQVEYVERLAGMEIYNQDYEHIGNLHDVVVDIDRQRVAYGVMSHGGLLGIGDKLFAVPWQAFQLREMDVGLPGMRYALYLPVNTQTLEEAEGFDKNDWPDLSDPRWASQVENQFRDAVQQNTLADTGIERTELPANLVKASDLIGYQVRTSDEVEVGELRDIVVDMNSSRIPYAVVSVEELAEDYPAFGEDTGYEYGFYPKTPDTTGYYWYVDEYYTTDYLPGSRMDYHDYYDYDFGYGYNYYDRDYVEESVRGASDIGTGHYRLLQAVAPWSSISISRDERLVWVNTNPQTLSQLAYAEGLEPDLNSPSYAQAIAQAYGTESYWSVFGYRAPEGREWQEPDRSKDWPEYQEQYDRMNRGEDK